MNRVNIIGRLTRDPEIRMTRDSAHTIARFSIAVDIGKKPEGRHGLHPGEQLRLLREQGPGTAGADQRRVYDDPGQR